MIGLILRYTGAVPRALRKEFRLILARAYLVAGQWWHAQMRPKHFTERGAREYGYPRRTQDYEIRKFRKFGHRDPLVWSGESRRFTSIRDIRANSKGVRVVMPAGNLLTRNNPKDKTNKAAELVFISRAEERELGRIVDKFMNRELNLIRFAHRVDFRRSA